MPKKNAIILCSGGLDSVTTAHYAKNQEYKIIILFFDYQQRNRTQEMKSAQQCAKDLKSQFMMIKIPGLVQLSSSFLHSQKQPRKIKSLKNTHEESKSWYVPCRNLIFLSYALALGEFLALKNHQTYDIFLGFKHEGKEYYSDTTPSFLAMMNKLNTRITVNKGKIKAPLITKDKEDIITLGHKLKINYEKTYSCYLGRPKHCGYCVACKLRQAGFYWSGIPDTTKYESKHPIS